MNELEQYRKQIDAIDEEMIALFESRMHCVREIIAYKIENQMEIFQQGREEAVLAHALSVLRDQDLAPYLKAFLINTMNLSKAYQASLLPSEPMSYPQPRQGNLLIGYQGVPGSFSSHAVKTYFGDVGMQDYDHFAEVFQALLEDRIDYGVLPLENSTTGAINDNYDLITSYGFYIAGEISCSIDQYLLGIKGADLSTIKEVYSHPQALLQTGRFLDAHHIRKCPHEDTAGAAADIARKQDPACGAIASLEAAKLYDLEVIAGPIQNDPSNRTRFVVIAKHLEIDEESSRISIVFTVPREVGLSHVMAVFKEHNIKIVRIQSRPLAGKPWEYSYYVDINGILKDQNVLMALNRIQAATGSMRLLGSYRCIDG